MLLNVFSVETERDGNMKNAHVNKKKRQNIPKEIFRNRFIVTLKQYNKYLIIKNG